MGKTLKIIKEKFALLGGSKEEFPLEHRILNLYLGIVALAFPSFILLNMIVGASWLANLPIAAVLMLHAVFFYLARVKRIHGPVGIASILTWFIIIPMVFISSFGFQGGPAYAPVLLLLYICAATQGKTRYILLAISMLETIGLYLLNFFTPQLFLGYASETGRFFDILFTMLLANSLCCLILLIVKNEYDHARREAQYLLEKHLELSRKNEYFVKVFAHDMKNRLTAGIPILELCSATPEKEYLQEAIVNEKEMSNMVANLINLFSEEKIVLDKERIEAASLIAGLKEHWAVSFRSREIDFVCVLGDLTYLWVDKKYMELVWNNLLSNIFQHAPGGTKVLVELSQKDNFACVAFLNSGKLIPSEARKNLFTQYFSAERQTVYHKSLGLNYSKMMCQLHGGDLAYTVENNMNKFTVKIPFLLTPGRSKHR